MRLTLVLAVLLLLLSAIPLSAGRIDVTDEITAWVHTGAYLDIQFGVSNYGRSNPSSSPYPTEINIQLAGQDVASARTRMPDGASLDYYAGYLWYGVLESMDGSYSVPFQDASAGFLGLPAGYLLVLPGVYNSGSSDPITMGVTSGTLSLTIEQSERLFGSNLGNYSSAARIRLRNLGRGIAIGVDPNLVVRNWITEPGISGMGSTEVAGITGHVTVANPEPATWMTLAGAFGLLGILVRRRRCASRSRT